jgi:hypothetical protein
VVEFRVGGEDIGGEVELSRAEEVEVRAKASFDPGQDDLAVLELVQNGDVIERVSRTEGASEIELSLRARVDETSWFAVRGSGNRLENTFATPLHFSAMGPSSHLHTAPIWVSVEGAPGIEKSGRARRVAREWLERLEDLERVLAPENLPFLAKRLEFPDLDGIPEETLRRNRDALLIEIEAAREFFAAYLE